MSRTRPDARLRLGIELKRCRTNAGMTGAELARQTGISQPTISRTEAGKTRPTPENVTAILEATEADAETRARVLDLVADAAVDIAGWQMMYKGGIGPTQKILAAGDAVATRIRHVQPFTVPGFFQPWSYARAAIAGFRLSDGPEAERKLDEGATTRVERGRAMQARTTVPYHVVVTELGLRLLPTGVNLSVRTEAYRAMLDAASLPHVTIQVIPADAPVEQVPICGWVMYDQPVEADDRLIVQVETPGALFTLSDPEDVAPFELSWTRWTSSALSPAESAQFLRRLVGDE